MWCQWPVWHVEGSPFCSSVLRICVYVYNQIHAHTPCQWARSSHSDYFPQLLLPHNLLGVSNPCLILLASHPTLPHISATLTPYWGKQENTDEEQMSLPLALRPQRLWQEGTFPFLCCGSSHRCSADPAGLLGAWTWEKISRQAVFTTLSEPKLLSGFFLKLRRPRFLGLSICMQGSGLWAYQVHNRNPERGRGLTPWGCNLNSTLFLLNLPAALYFPESSDGWARHLSRSFSTFGGRDAGRVLTPASLELALPALFSVVSLRWGVVCVCVCVYFEVSIKSTTLLTSGRNNL